MAALTVEMFLQ